jgi:hypothetical protein
MATPRPSSQNLLDLNPDKIRKNPNNPRMIFREEEMTELLELPAKYRQLLMKEAEKPKGEQKPTKLENLLMMFNIHNVRVQWDIMPMAYKSTPASSARASLLRLRNEVTLDSVPPTYAQLRISTFEYVRRLFRVSSVHLEGQVKSGTENFIEKRGRVQRN